MVVSEKKVFRNDDIAKVTGRAKYADDYTFHGMIHAVPVYTNSVHAEILNIYTSEAEAFEGVRKVLTWKDVPGLAAFGQIEKDLYIFAKDKIRYHGDVIALVVADTRDIALEASKLVHCDLKELPPILDQEKAILEGSSLVHDQFPGNKIAHHHVRRGDVEKVFPECHLIVEREFRTQFVEHAYIEPECAFANPRADGVIELYGTFQHPFSTRRFVAAYLNRQFADFTVYSHPVGGSFGGKDDTISVIAARAALASSILKVPVKILYDREWSFRESYKRNPYIMKYKYGLSKEGKLKAVNTYMLSESGAVTSTTPWSTWRSTAQCAGPYQVENVHTDVFGVATNNVFTGAMRGFGTPQVNFAIEQMMDICAEELGMDPVEMRRINMVRQDCETITGQKLDGHKVSMEEVMDKILIESNYSENVKKNSRGVSNSDEYYGTGLAISYRGSSVGAEGLDFAACIINCQFDGSIILDTGIHENGQGAQAVMMLALAKEFDVPLSRINYNRSSTTSIPDSGTTVATRGTMMGISAIKKASISLKKTIRDTLCDDFRCDPEDIRFENDRLIAGSYNISWEEAMHKMFLHRTYPFAFGEYKAPRVSWNDDIGVGDAYFTYVYSCNVVELNVNKKTGKVTLLKVTAGHDIGHAINEGMVLGQIYGGIAQGAGMALMEELIIEEGRIQNPNFNKYKIPKAADIPEISAFIIENEDHSTPSGVKGIGEPATELIAAAISNAVYNATGKRQYSLPIRIEGEK
ncbi:MAG: xanthine dehydrogenase family protein molybdopterin-binding subunit [Spirochaetaceae bacterium]|jgi:CO/xanthine dehydrogenase Mo-binding subunit|nr:xanthine dehydrogenase family protein molybdopterin-binding subunit [Spirochaetaceae bacterium]